MSGTMAQHIYAQNPGRATMAPWTDAPTHQAGGTPRGGRPHATLAPSLITIDPQDWVDPDEVDGRDVHDPLMLASLVLVSAHLSERCGDKGHSADCRAALHAMGHATFDDLLVGLGIDIHAVADMKRYRTTREGRHE